MNPSDAEPSRFALASAAEDVAADWLVRRNAGFAPGEDAEFRQWLGASPAHAAAFAQLEQAWATLNQPRAAGRAEWLARALDGRAKRRAQRLRAYAVAGLGLAAAAAVLFFLRAAAPLAPAPSAPPTMVARPDRQTLPDGSTVERNAATDLVLEFTPEIRGVRLLRGEALFEVAKNAARPFVVTSGGVEVRAVGTAFAVRCQPQQVDVLVTEGRVAIARSVPSPAPEDAIHLDAGHRVVVPADLPAATPLTATPLTPAEIAAALAWRGHRIEFTGITLAAAVQLFNRENRRQLSVADPDLARLQISGIFWSDDPDGFVRLLESGMSVRAERAPDLIVLRRQ